MFGFALVEKGPWSPNDSSQKGLSLQKNESNGSPRAKFCAAIHKFVSFVGEKNIEQRRRKKRQKREAKIDIFYKYSESKSDRY